MQKTAIGIALFSLLCIAQIYSQTQYVPSWQNIMSVDRGTALGLLQRKATDLAQGRSSAAQAERTEKQVFDIYVSVYRTARKLEQTHPFLEDNDSSLATLPTYGYKPPGSPSALDWSLLPDLNVSTAMTIIEREAFAHSWEGPLANGSDVPPALLLFVKNFETYAEIMQIPK
jgi:hypothetical protein